MPVLRGMKNLPRPIPGDQRADVVGGVTSGAEPMFWEVEGVEGLSCLFRGCLSAFCWSPLQTSGGHRVIFCTIPPTFDDGYSWSAHTTAIMHAQRADSDSKAGRNHDTDKREAHGSQAKDHTNGQDQKSNRQDNQGNDEYQPSTKAKQASDNNQTAPLRWMSSIERGSVRGIERRSTFRTPPLR